MIKNIFSYVLIGAIGFFVTAFSAVFSGGLVLACVGALASIILAFYFVPKGTKK